VVEGASDSDDEDKLHIVEEEGSLPDGADCDSNLHEEERNGDRWDEGEEHSNPRQRHTHTYTHSACEQAQAYTYTQKIHTPSKQVNSR